MENVYEIMLLKQIIGILDELLNETMSIEASEGVIFSPKKVKQLQMNQCDKRIVSIVEEGCELEDIYSLIPKKYKKNVVLLKMKALVLLKEYEETKENDIHNI